LSKLLHCKVSVVEWQCKNEASVHKTAKEFAIDHESVHKCYSTMKGQTCGVLGKCYRLRCGQSLSVNLDQKAVELLEDGEVKADL